ncbi:MAG: type I-E CRISPR-associated protein Cse1/CasA [Thermoguttaceae bacterium]|nr:type I-E CRISPR-associated protein Cse1/CasA [Thermoguttaceae bacterium]
MSENSPPKSFNLVTKSWLSIAGVGVVSLDEVFAPQNLQKFKRLGGTPIEKVVILRLLLCIVHASSPIPDLNAWIALTPEKLASNAREYLKIWSDRFDLYDEVHPFLQFPNRERGKVVSWWNLGVSSTDNNSVFTQSELKCVFSEAEKARLLLCGVCYSCRRKAEKLFSPYSLMGESGYLHSFLLGKNLLETICLNLLTLKDIQELNMFKNNLGKPFWEMDFTSPKWKENYQKSYQGSLFPLDKFLYIESDGVRRDEGIPYPKSIKDGFWDPGITIFSKEKSALICSTEKLPWRSLGAILQSAMQEKGKSSAFLKYGIMRICKKESISHFGIWCGGAAVQIARVKTQKIAGKYGFVDSEFQITTSDYDDPWWEQYQKFITQLDEYATCVRSSVINYYKAMTDPEKNKKSKDSPFCKNMGKEAERLFWEKMEHHSNAILKLACKYDNEEEEFAQKKWQDVAFSCYEDLCPCMTPRQIQVYVENRPRFPQTSKGKEN